MTQFSTENHVSPQGKQDLKLSDEFTAHTPTAPCTPPTAPSGDALRRIAVLHRSTLKIGGGVDLICLQGIQGGRWDLVSIFANFLQYFRLNINLICFSSN